MTGADSSVIHVVGFLQGLLDDIGRVFPGLIDAVAPAAPRALCGLSLVCDSDVEPDPPAGAEVCPECAAR